MIVHKALKYSLHLLYSHSALEEQVLDCLHYLLASRGVMEPGPSAPPSLSLSLTITQLGGDSLVAMRLSSLVQEKFSIELSAQFLLQRPLIDVYQLLLSSLLPSKQHPR